VRPRLLVSGAASRLDGPLLFLRRTLNVGLNHAVSVQGGDGKARLGRIAALDEEFLTIELLEASAGLALADTVVRYAVKLVRLTRPTTEGSPDFVRQWLSGRRLPGFFSFGHG